MDRSVMDLWWISISCWYPLKREIYGAWKWTVNDTVCTRLGGYLHRGMNMKEANESEEQCTTWEQWDGENKIEAVICTEMGKTILWSQHKWVKLVYEAENVCAVGEKVVNMQKGKRVWGKQRQGRPERGKERGGAQICQRTQKGKGVVCLGAGETLTAWCTWKRYLCDLI